eukprot:CAMPEP_0182852724 /NCGR_PEP_ID=MMETSP0034_2-20130328/319_1 /TAXON_ID=156128 /ORGANISM="Nephroselmis pyriformis, Strain CCMP717" /LENGTH=359 /DNA_ID=CAMNT_0024983457 /DNA_START=13 /DNA_END=1093 /DNA_ORIENTATION=-
MATPRLIQWSLGLSLASRPQKFPPEQYYSTPYHIRRDGGHARPAGEQMGRPGGHHRDHGEVGEQPDHHPLVPAPRLRHPQEAKGSEGGEQKDAPRVAGAKQEDQGINAAAASAHAAEREAREAARGEDGIAQPPAPAADAEPPAAPADGAAAAAGSGSPAQGGDAGLGDGRAGGTERAGGTTPGEAGDPAPASGEVFAKPKAEEARQPGLPIASGGFGAGLPEAHQQLLGLFPGALGQMGSLAQLGMRPPLPGGLYFGGPAPLLQPPAGLWPPGGLPPSTSSGVGALAPAAGGLHILLQRPPTSAAGAASSIPQPVSPPAAPPAAPLPPPPRPPLVSPGGGPVTLSLADIIPTSSSVKP